MINILNSSKKRKIKDCQEGWRNEDGCEVLKAYKELVSLNLPIREITSELEAGLKNISQSKITSFFTRKSQSSTQASASISSHCLTQPQPTDADTENNAAANRETTNQKADIFVIFEVSSKNAENIIKSVKLDKDILNSKGPVETVKVFTRVYKDLESKKTFDRDSKLTSLKRSVIQSLDEIKESFRILGGLCDTEKNSSEASKLSLEDMVQFLKAKSEEANKIAREIFLRLNSTDFLDQIKDVDRKSVV